MRPSVQDDEERLISELRTLGNSAGNQRLIQILRWTPERYWARRDSLVDAGTLIVGRGRGGSVSIAEANVDPDFGSVTEKAVRDELTAEKKESDLYAPVKSVLETEWVKSQGIRDSQFLLEVTAQLGKRDTGGVWTRPDLTLYECRAHDYLPGKTANVHTFEVKLGPPFDVRGVFEASSHRMRGNFAYLIAVDNGKRPEGVDLDPIKAACGLQGVGLIYTKNVRKFSEWQTLIEAKYNACDPFDLSENIGRLFSGTGRDHIGKLIR